MAHWKNPWRKPQSFAKSVALEHYEQRISETFERVEPLTTQLAKTGRVEWYIVLLAVLEVVIMLYYEWQ